MHYYRFKKVVLLRELLITYIAGGFLSDYLEL